MKKLLLGEKILDLNDLQVRYIGADNEVHARTYAGELNDALARTSVPVPKIDIYRAVAAKVEAALTAGEAVATELTDEEFELLDAKAKRIFDQVTLWRWNKMVESANAATKAAKAPAAEAETETVTEAEAETTEPEAAEATEAAESETK